MKDEDAGIASRLGNQSLGIWTRGDALEAFTRGQVHARLRAGAWQRLFHGVYAESDQLSPEQWAVAAVLACGGSGELEHQVLRPATAVVAGRSAARIWGLPLIDDNDPATGSQERRLHDVITHRVRAQSPSKTRPQQPSGAPPGTRREHVRELKASPRLLQRHAWNLLEEEVTRLPSGLWITTPIRTALDCALLLAPDAAVCLFDQGLRSGQLAVPALTAAIEARAGGRGVTRLRATLAQADARAESVAETLARLLLLPWIPGLVPQVRVRDGSGAVVARLDLADPHLRLAIEVDGRRGHEGWQMAAKDRARDRTTASLGWRTERVTWFELRKRPEPFVIHVRTLAAQLQARAA